MGLSLNLKLRVKKLRLYFFILCLYKILCWLQFREHRIQYHKFVSFLVTWLLTCREASSMRWSVCCVQTTNLAETEWRERSKTYRKRIQPCTALKRSLSQTMCLLFVRLVVVYSTYSFQLELPAKHKMLDVPQFEPHCWFQSLPLFLRVLWVSI